MLLAPDAPATAWDTVVIGAGQAGLSAAHHLVRRGISTLVLDANPGPGGAWQHRWDSLLMDGVHGVSDLPDAPAPAPSLERANQVIPTWFGRYERDQGLQVRRPVQVTRVTSTAPGTTAALRIDTASDGSVLTRTIVNATGTWDRPFVPHVAGRELFRGREMHTADYRGADELRGLTVGVVGAGASAVQLIGEIAPVANTHWFTRREPRWADSFDGLAAVTQVESRVVAGLPPESVVSLTGLTLRPQERRAAELGAYRRRPMFTGLTEDGVRLADGTELALDVILWATGFRHAITHLAPLKLRSQHGGVSLLPGPFGPQSATTAASDPRVQLVGYGPSASTIGANRAGMAAAIAVRKHLAGALASA